MKVALNATGFRPGKLGGMETYFRDLVSALERVDDLNDYVLLCNDETFKDLSGDSQRFSQLFLDSNQPSFLWLARGVVRNLTKFDLLTTRFERLQADVVHHPFSFMNPIHRRIPSVVTFHDMQHEFFPEYFSPYDKKVRNEFYRPSAERATRIVAISNYTRSSLVEKYGVDPSKVDVVYNGYSPAYRVMPAGAALEAVGRKYGLDRPFLYYPAATWPHKNHSTLLKAVRILKERNRFDGRLVLTGVRMNAHENILGEINRLGLRETVKVLGYVPYEDLPVLYNLARLVVFPSLFEGFGIPLLEAMACGCPVACSDVTSIPEVAGNAGLFFDPASAEDIAEKAWLLWTDEALRKRLTNAGLERVKLFTWDDAARKTISVYQKALVH